MSKELRAVRAGTTYPIGAPYTKIGGVWTLATKVYKKEAGAWVEWWPLRPLPPTDLSLTFSYVNDRIELNLTWKGPTTGTLAASYDVTIAIPGRATISFNTTSLTYHPALAFQAYAGQPATATVLCRSDAGKPGYSSASVVAQVPQLPPPPAPTSVALSLANRAASLSWAHVGGNRLSSFELLTSYKSDTQGSTAAKGDRSANVTFWSTASVPGDPGGAVGSLVRALGPGGASDWASASGVTIPNIPNPPPPPVIQVPGAATVTNHRFYLGQLYCEYSCSNADAANVWWQRNEEAWVYMGSFAPSRAFAVPGSEGWARDQITRYRIIVQGTNSGGAGTAVGGQYCIKIPNPYNMHPVDTIAVRHNARYNDGLMRQGGSYNEYDYRNPIIQWKSYAVYGDHITTAMNRNGIGYDLTVTKAQILLRRKDTGGSGGGVRPQIWYHRHVNPGDVPMAIIPALEAPHSLEPFNRNEGKWQDLNLDYARWMVSADPNATRGVAIYHQNFVLNKSLGEVSNEYLMMYGHGYDIFGMPLWTIQLTHDA
jgi:hypothetical protein